MCRFLALSARTGNFGLDTRRYVRDLGHVIHGNIDWASTVPRYMVVIGAGLPVSGGSSRDRPGITAREVEPVVAPEGCTPEELARDERFWTRVASRLPTTPGIVNLENGYYGIMPAPVRQAYLTNMDRLNESNSYLLRTSYKAELEDIGRKLAAMAGAAVLDTYARALHDHPRVGLLLLSHMNNHTGLVVPVREVVAMAAQRGVDVIVDAAHSWGQLDFTIPDLGGGFRRLLPAQVDQCAARRRFSLHTSGTLG